MHSSFYFRSVERIVIGCLIVMVIVTLVSTLIRFLVPGMGGIYWAEEVTRYVSVWMVFLGAALGLRFGVHLHVDLIVGQLPEGVQRAFRIGTCVLLLCFEGVLVWYGTIVAHSNMDQQSSSLLLPMGYIYAAIPVGGLMMMYESLRAMVSAIRGLPLTPPAETLSRSEMAVD